MSNSSSAPKGVHDTEPLKKTVGDYPERPYSEAVTKEHRAVLEEQGLVFPKGAEGDPSQENPA